MANDASFEDLLLRIRDSDPDAAREIVSRYEKAIRVAVRTRMSGTALRPQFDSLDVGSLISAVFPCGCRPGCTIRMNVLS